MYTDPASQVGAGAGKHEVDRHEGDGRGGKLKGKQRGGLGLSLFLLVGFQGCVPQALLLGDLWQERIADEKKALTRGKQQKKWPCKVLEMERTDGLYRGPHPGSLTWAGLT